AWERALEGGRHCPDALLTDCGVDVARIAAVPGALEIFDWACGISISRMFALAEANILRFEADAGEKLAQTRSLTLLLEEEKKHIALFERYEAHLLTLHPALVPAVNAAFEPTAKCFEARFQELDVDAPESHFLFWLTTLYFEEFTVYLDDRLRAESGVQPTWASAHAAHRREEVQHVATDAAYLEAIHLTPPTLHRLSQSFVFGMYTDILHLWGLACPLAFLEAMHPTLAGLVPNGRITQRKYVQDVLCSRTFKRTRQFAPYLSELAHASTGAR
ncbi:MAG: hypothetical protein ACRELY_00745, partial [Polyangiaceae bacterium]